jgi:hypothetical protein
MIEGYIVRGIIGGWLRWNWSNVAQEMSEWAFKALVLVKKDKSG